MLTQALSMNENLQQLIADDHSRLREQIDHLTSTTIKDVDARLELFEEVSSRLYAHERAEQSTLYSEMKVYDEAKPIALLAEEQERIVRILAVELRDVKLDDELWLPKMLAIHMLTQQHMALEEQTILPLANQIFDDATMNRLSMDFKKTHKEYLEKPPTISD